MLFLQQEVKKVNFLYVLANIPLFRKINEKDISVLMQQLNSKLKKFENSQYVFTEGDVMNHEIGIVISGHIEILRNDIMGNRTIIAECGPGELFGEAFAFSNLKIFPINVISIKNSEILFLNSHAIIHNATKSKPHEQLIENMLGIMAQKNIYLSQKHEILSSRSIRKKLMTYFTILSSNNNSNTIILPFDRQGLADYLSVDRSAMSSELGKMKKDGLIDYDKNKVILL